MPFNLRKHFVFVVFFAWAAFLISKNRVGFRSDACAQVRDRDPLGSPKNTGGVWDGTVLRHQKLTAETIRSRPKALEYALVSNKVYSDAFKKDDQVAPSKVIVSSGSRNTKVFPEPLGFVGAACLAYNNHHDLVLRPDDVWQAIVTQFSFYVQGNSMLLRHKFVAHWGKKQLNVQARGSLFSAPYEYLCAEMLVAMKKHLKDPSVIDWLQPNFTTTTDADRVASAISVMSTLQAYFEYKFSLLCGLSSVELLGTVDDWKKLLTKANRLAEFDPLFGWGRLGQWQRMLQPVLVEFVRTKQGTDNMDWWQRICHYSGGGSGPSYLSGWITVFAVFNAKGGWQGNIKSCDTPWPVIETDDIPTAILTVPVKVDDNGREYNTHLFAGQFSFDSTTRTDVRPRTDWCLAVSEDQLTG